MKIKNRLLSKINILIKKNLKFKCINEKEKVIALKKKKKLKYE